MNNSYCTILYRQRREYSTEKFRESLNEILHFKCISFRYFNTSGDITRFQHHKSAVFVIRKSRNVKKHHDVVIVVRDAVQRYTGALQIGCSTISGINNATADQQTAALCNRYSNRRWRGDLGRTSARGSQHRRHRSVPELPVPLWPWPALVWYQRQWTAWPERSARFPAFKVASCSLCWVTDFPWAIEVTIISASSPSLVWNRDISNWKGQETMS